MKLYYATNILECNGNKMATLLKFSEICMEMHFVSLLFLFFFFLLERLYVRRKLYGYANQ